MKYKSLYEDAQAVLKQKETMGNYSIQEEVLQFLVKKYPNNKIYDAVDTKVKLLNLFYATGIQATATMTRHIMSIKDIDRRLKNGDLSLVPEIANLKLNKSVRYNYSFATKYCALHEPEKFPIYDSIVAEIFKSLLINDLLYDYHYSSTNDESKHQYQKGTFSEKLKDYPFFVELYRSFKEQYHLNELTYREVDSYLWGAYKLPGKEFEIELMTKLDKSKYVEYKKLQL